MNAVKETKSIDTTLRMILMIAVCFAIGAIGAFLAVWMQSSRPTPVATVQNLVPAQEQKNAAVQSLTESMQQHNTAPATTSVAVGVATSTAHTVRVSPSQADPKDPNAALKLQLANQLNAK
jgi:flagellar biosynthesis/type III secretory pathway M-ring protein FliF/YscJ